MDTPYIRIHEVRGSWDYPLSKALKKIGRARSNDVVLAERVNISRYHLEIRKGDSGWFLRDLGTTFGTRVDAKPVKVHPLHHGDRIHIGSSDLSEIQFFTKELPNEPGSDQTTEERTTRIHDLQIKEACAWTACYPPPDTPGARNPSETGVVLSRPGEEFDADQPCTRTVLAVRLSSPTRSRMK